MKKQNEFFSVYWLSLLLAFCQQFCLAQDCSRGIVPEQPALDRWAKRVVEIEVRPHDVPFGSEVVVGTGVIVNGSGLIVSCDHVVASEGRITVITQDGRRHPYRISVRRPQVDLVFMEPEVVEQFEFDGLICELSPSVGQDVICLFNYTNTGITVTKGCVSALNKRTRTNQLALEKVHMVDLTIGPGGSGAPVFTVDGKWVGLAASIEKDRSFAYMVPIGRVVDEYIQAFSTRLWNGVEFPFTWRISGADFAPAIVVSESSNILKVVNVGSRQAKSIFEVLPLLRSDILSNSLNVITEKDGTQLTSTFSAKSVKIESSTLANVEQGLNVHASSQGDLDGSDHFLKGVVPDLECIDLRRSGEAIDLRFQGLFLVKESGRHEFIVESDTQVIVSIGGQSRIHKPPSEITRAWSEAFFLEPGHHSLQIDVIAVKEKDRFGVMLVDPRGKRDALGPSHLFRQAR